MSLATSAKLKEFENRFEFSNSKIQAFVPEDGRFERLGRRTQELAALSASEQDAPLHGILVGVKDIFHVDGLPTTAGSRIPPDSLAGPQAEAVTRLRAAGSLIVGKTVTTEFAYFAPGPTRNPRNPGHTPGGSSSGSAAGVAAELCQLALGTQTIGSVTRPAAFCGIVGFKPSYDRFSRSGVIPLSPSLDHVGLFATDLGLIGSAAGVLADDWDHAVEGSDKPVLAIPEGPYFDDLEQVGREHFAATVETLRLAGFQVKSVPAMEDIEEIRRRHQIILSAEVSRAHAHWIDQFEALYDPRTLALIESGRRFSEHDLKEALAGRVRLRQELHELSQRHGIDIWISPAATGPAPAGIDSTGSPAMNLPWTQAGVPTLGLPSSVTDTGLPLGLQLAAGWWQDERLLQWGSQIEPHIRPAALEGGTER